MILLCINGIVGSGIFLLPGQIAAICGNWALLVYFMSATVVMAIGWCFAKCSGHFSRNGGAYLYAKEAFGDFVGFEIVIMRWVVYMIAWASLTVGFVTALGTLAPIVLVAPYKQILIITLILSLSALNIFGVKNVNRCNNLITTAKLLPLLAFLGFGIFALHGGNFVLENNPLVVSTLGTGALVIFYAFGGFDSLPTAASDMHDSKKNIPRAMMIAIFFASILYFLVQGICIGVLGPHLAGSASPIADVAAVLFGPIGKLLVSCAMLLSIGGIIVVSSFMTPRSCQAMSVEGSFFPKFFEENRFGSPYMAIVLSAILTMAMALSGSFVQLVTISVVSRFAQYITTCLSLYVFEKQGVMQPFNRPWKRIIPLFALTGIAWLIVHAELYQLIWGFGALVLGVPLYFLQKRFTVKQAIEE